MGLTKKNFVGIAEVIRSTEMDDDTRETLVRSLSKLFAEWEHGFQAKRFIAACGVSHGETLLDVDCGHCIRPEDRCSDESDRNCMARNVIAAE